jgi:hypothetical protein
VLCHVSDEGKTDCWEVFQVGKERLCVGVTYDGFSELELPNHLGCGGEIKGKIGRSSKRGERGQARR